MEEDQPGWGSLAFRIATSLLIFAGWMTLVTLALKLPRWWLALPAVLGTAAAFLHFHGGRRPPPERQQRQREDGRLRPLGATAPYVALAVPVYLLAEVSLLMVFYSLAGPSSGGAEGSGLGGVFERPFGWMAGLVSLAVVGPMIEELTFRGWVQRPLERRIGPLAAILVTAALFAIMHRSLRGLVPRVFGGVVFGGAVYFTRSIRAGVILHAVDNAALVLLALLVSTPPEWPLSRPETIALGAAGLALSAFIFLKLVQRVRAVHAPE